MRGISNLAAEETQRRLDRSSEAQDRRIQMQVQGAGVMGQGIREGVNSFLDRSREARKDNQEEARLDRAEQRADRGESRADRQQGMAEEEFGLRKPELAARARTAEERTDLEIQQGRAGLRGTEANADLATAQAASAKAEEAWKASSAENMPNAMPGETMRQYVLRMDLEGQKANRDLAIAQLEEQKAGRPMRERLTQAQIDATMAGIANTRQQTAQAKAVFDAEQEGREVEKLSAMLTRPTPEQLRATAPYLADKVNSGEISPEKAALVLANVKNKEQQRMLQQQLVNNANPEYQDKISRTFKARDKAENYLSAIAEMESALAQNQANALFTDDGARERFANMLDAVGMAKDAEKIRSGFDLGAVGDADNPLGLTGRMETLLAKVKAAARSQMNVESEAVKSDPIVQQLSARINALDSSGASTTGNKPALFGGAQQPMNAGQTPGIFPGGPGGINQPVLPSPNAKKRVAPAQFKGGQK
jgi:hypothetical protein